MAKHFDSETLGAKLGTLESHYGTIGQPIVPKPSLVAQYLGNVKMVYPETENTGIPPLQP